MRALTVKPGSADSLRLENVAEPSLQDGSVLVRTRAVGVCGTDVDIAKGEYGEAPAGAERLIIGHEAVGTVVAAPPGSGLEKGDCVVGIVRRRDPVPCANCAAGEWDMCSNGLYTERGIKGLHGFAADRFRADPEYLVRSDRTLDELNVLVEPASVVAKAWDHIERICRRATWQPGRVLVTGAGPIGLLATLMAVQRGYEVHVIDRVESGEKPALVRELGGQYHVSAPQEALDGADIVLECTGAPALFFDVIELLLPNGIVCLTGVSSGGHRVGVDAGALNREIVLENNVVFGSVNANRRHYEAGAAALAQADPQWLARLITRRVPVENWPEAYQKQPGDVKTVLVFED
ncbi:MAG: glucose 1-dehydrogenase [Gemmatimonadota bacterium]